MPGAITPAQARNSLGGAVDETGMLTSGQQTFASVLANDTGLDFRVIAAWLLAEESGSAAKSRQASNNNDWLNIGYTGSGTFGAGDAIWNNPASAATATANWLKGQASVPGYGTASKGIQGILAAAKDAPAQQVQAIQKSGWAASGYPSLPNLYNQVAGSNTTAAKIADAAAAPLVGAGDAVSSTANAIASIPGAITGVFNSLVGDAKYAAVFVALIAFGVMLMFRAFTSSTRSSPTIIEAAA